MTKKFTPPRGTRDLMPKEFKIWQELFQILRRIAERYGYQPIETPAFESFDMLSAKYSGGEEIKDQIYYFKDKSGREMGLRFDITAPIARIVANNPQIPKPIKYYHISKAWRYERPQEGRFREFWQFGIELIGSDEPIADSEVVAVAVDLLRELGLDPKDIKIFIGNRKVLEGFVRSLGVPKKKVLDIFRVIDKKDKISKEKMTKKLQKCKVPREGIRKIFDLIKLKGDPRRILERARTLSEHKLFQEGLQDLENICKDLEHFGILKYCAIDLGIARGLDYYTDTIFEAFEVENGTKVGSSIFGGGRYDNLIEVYGGEPTPATGWAMGIERLTDLLEKKERLPEVRAAPEVYVAIAGNVRDKAIEITQTLRENDIETDLDLRGRSLALQLSYADSREIPYVLIVGEKDLEKGQVTLKEMETGEEWKVKTSELLTGISEKIC